MAATHFLPNDLLPVKLLGRIHGANGHRPNSVEFSGVAMFVDVSRYTALVEQLARRGREGLEDLPRLLSISYGRCSEYVADHGGEVLYFAGDSLLAYWDANSNLGAAVQSAVNCAETICKAGNKRRHDSESKITPSLHIGIGVGRLWAAALGDPPVWNLIAGGEAVVQAAKAQANARSWSYELSDSARLSLAEFPARIDGLVQQKESGPADPDIDWMAAFLPLQVREYVTAPASVSKAFQGLVAEPRHKPAPSLSDLTEVRPVSAVFARIVGLDCAGDCALQRHQELCVALQGITRTFGGPPGGLVYDDKGLVFSTTFGARGSFHRDDARRAVDAARTINEAVHSLRLASSIGVSTGEALFGLAGSERRCQYMPHGAPINRAARLMMAVDRGILCDAPTERATRSAFRFEPRGTLQLAGLGDMAAVFSPMESQATPLDPAPLVGRRTELTLLNGIFEEARTGSKRLVVVMGESGIGKSSLIASFAEQLRTQGATVAIASAERDDRRASLLPWRRLLVSLLHMKQNADGADVLEAIRSRVANDPKMVERLPLLDAVLGTRIRESESTRHLQGAHRGDATMRLVGELIAALIPTTAVLILEDSHWLDSASWRLVEWVSANQSALLMVLCVRSEEIPEELRSLQRRAEARSNSPGGDLDDPARSFRVIALGELNDPEIRELTNRTLGDAAPERELADRICSLAGGNPLFAEEIVLTLKSEGLIAIRQGLWRSLRPLDELRYFEGVDRVIRERIDLLPARMLDVLKAAAVIGRSFSLRLLELLHKDASSRLLLSALDKLIDANFVSRSNADGLYVFRHDQIRDVVYGSIPAEIRQNLHGSLADSLEADAATATGTDIATLVQHFEAAGKSEKAVAYAEIAAAKALQVGAYREVEAFLAICFSYESKQFPLTEQQRARAVRWRIQLAEAHYCRGDIHAQGVAIRRALTLAEESMPRSFAANILQIAKSSTKLLLQQLIPISEPSTAMKKSWELELSRCHGHAGTVDYFELRYVEGMRHLVESVVHAERAGNSTELAVSASQFACGLGFAGYRRTCEYFFRKAERAAIAICDPAIRSHVYMLDALWRIGRCDWEMVDYRVHKSQELSLAAGDQLRWSNAQVIRFWSLFYKGNWGSLEEIAQGLLTRAQSSGNIQQEIWALRCKSMCALHADRPREATEILRLITSAMLGSADLAAHVSSKGSLALALARMGSNDESIQAATDTLRMLRGMRRPTSHSTLVGIAGVCEVLLRGREAGLSRDYDLWSEWESEALRELKRYSKVFHVGIPQYGLWSGVAFWLEGDRDRALAIWKRALSNASRLSLRQDEAMIAAEIRRRQERL